MPSSKHTVKPLKLLPSSQNSARDYRESGEANEGEPLMVGSAGSTDMHKNVLHFRPTGPHGENPDEGYHVKVGDKIVVEIRLTVESVGYHPDRTFVLGRAEEDGSMVTFDEEAVRGIFWNWD